MGRDLGGKKLEGPDLKEIAMKIGIIGSGGVAQTLGGGYLAKGHKVRLGSRNPEKLSEWLQEAGENASTGTFTEAAEFGEVVFLSVKGSVALEAINLTGREALAGKTLVDLSNPLDFSGGFPPRFTATVGDSIGEQIQRALPETRVVKAFNTIGAAIMVDPKFNGDVATQFIAGDDKEAKATVADMAKEFGWDIEDLGGIEQSFFLEAFASLWINYGIKNDHWTHAFKFLKK